MTEISRRTALVASLSAAGGALTGAAATRLAGRGGSRGGPGADGPVAQPDAGFGVESEPFHGARQPGVTTAGQAHAVFCAFDARPELDRDAAIRMMRVLTDDIARLVAGRPALGDTAPELATRPARLTVTVGFGPRMFESIGRPERRPAGLAALPAFPSIDRLEERFSDGDLMLRIGGDDPTAIAHAQRMLMKDARAFVVPRWVQRGFLTARGVAPAGATPRNLMGQVDGTVNPGSDAEFDSLIWSTEAGWFEDGTTMVLRRLRMDLDGWDALDRSAMEDVIGRRLSDGAPLTGEREHDDPDFAALDGAGVSLIAPGAHIRVARGSGGAPTILRRGYNYDDSPDPSGASDLGLLFCSYQADIGAQFVPMQQRLADQDLLNTWVTPVGSAVFAILPGVQPGGFLGEGLLT